MTITPVLSELWIRHTESNNQQIYVIDRPMGDSKYTYDYSDRLIILSPGHKIVLMDFGTNKDGFEEFIDDFTEDLASISDKFQYKSIIDKVEVLMGQTDRGREIP